MEPSEEGRKRARPSQSEQTVLDAKSPGQVHPPKKVCLEDKIAMDATEKKIGSGPVERREGKAVFEEGENPLCLHKERHADTDSNGKDDSKCIRDDVRMHINEAEAINEAAEGPSAHTGKDSKQATVGPCCFTSSTVMLDFFYRLLHGWPLNLDINKYEHMMLEDLLKKGHPEWCEKVGTGIKAFQVRINPEFRSRCYYVIRKDDSTKEFSYRKCVDNILSLPKLLKPHSNQNVKGSKALLNNEVSKAQGSKTHHNSKGRGSKDRGGGRGISRHIQGRGNHGGHGIGNLGGIGRGIRGRCKHGGLGSGARGGAGCKF